VEKTSRENKQGRQAEKKDDRGDIKFTKSFTFTKLTTMKMHPFQVEQLHLQLVSTIRICVPFNMHLLLHSTTTTVY